jgi:hypothetical protein
MSATLFPDLACASSRSRARAADSLAFACPHNPDNVHPRQQPAGPLVLAAVVARKDWSERVRESALRAASALPWSSESTALLGPALRDPSPSVRAAAYAALAAAPAFDAVCAALALETEASVRRAAFAALERMAAGKVPVENVLLARLHGNCARRGRVRRCSRRRA